MKPDLEFHQLDAFIAVARAKNFTRAAEELGMSQSALSRAVQRLEQQIGQPLFERKPREVTLTDLGEWFLERADRIMRQVEDTFSEVSEFGKKGRLRLGVIPTIAPYFLPDLLRNFAESHPTVSVIVQEDTTDNLITRCSHGDIDLAILAIPVAAKYLEVEPLFTEDLFLVLPNNHPLADTPVVEISDIEPLPFVMLNEAHCLSETIVSFCSRQSVQPVSIERTSQLATVQELVSLGHGISLVPAMARRLDQTNRRVYREFTGEKPTRTIAMMWNPYRFVSKWVMQFQDHLRTCCHSSNQ